MTLRPFQVKSAVTLVVLAVCLQLVHAYAQLASQHSLDGLRRSLFTGFYWAIFATFLICAALLYFRQGWTRWVLLLYWLTQAVEMYNAKWQWYDGLQMAAIVIGALSLSFSFSKESSAWFRER